MNRLPYLALVMLLGCFFDPNSQTLPPYDTGDSAQVAPPGGSLKWPPEIHDPDSIIDHGWLAPARPNACPVADSGRKYGSFLSRKIGTEWDYRIFLHSRYEYDIEPWGGVPGGMECGILGMLHDSLVTTLAKVTLSGITPWTGDSLLVSFIYRTTRITDVYSRGGCMADRRTDTATEEFPWDYFVAKGGMSRWYETLGALYFAAQAIDADSVDLRGLRARDDWDSANRIAVMESQATFRGSIFRHTLHMRDIGDQCVPELWKESALNMQTDSDVRFAYRAGIGLIRGRWLYPVNPSSAERKTLIEITLERMRVPGEPEPVLTP